MENMELVTEETLQTVFSYHPPRKEQIERIKNVRNSAQKLARIIMENCPDSPERKDALNKLQYAHLLSKASIENNERQEFVPENEEDSQ